MTPVILAAVGFFAARAEKWFREKTKLELEAYHREALHSALRTGAQIVLARVSGDTAAAGAARAALLREIVDYAHRSVPDAIEALGAQFDILLDLAEAKLQSEGAKSAVAAKPVS